MSVPADAVGTVQGLAQVSVSGSTVSIVASRGFSGLITLPVLVSDGAARVETRILDVVSPAPAPVVRLTPGARTSSVTWTRSPNARRYTVRASGHVVCVTTSNRCDLRGLVGPGDHVTVTADGNDRTHSTPTHAATATPAPISVGTVYFATDSVRLTAGDRALLQRVATVLTRTGLRHLELSGYTDNVGGYRYNLALSERRARVVAAYLEHLMPRATLRYTLHHFSYLHPAAPNSSIAGRALNRRTAVAVD